MTTNTQAVSPTRQLPLSLSTEPVLFQYDQASSIAHITLNRPKVLNAINLPLLEALVTSLTRVASLRAQVCILSAAGTSFCSGEDLKQTLAPASEGGDPEELRASFFRLQEITRLLSGSETVFIACVQGWAVGGGAEIALASDFIIAGPDAKFSFPDVTHAQAPTGGITARLPQIVGIQQAKRLLLLGETLSASEAMSMHLITELSTDPFSRSLELAVDLSRRPKRSLGNVKRCLELVTFPHMEGVLRSEIDVASWCFMDGRSSDVFKRFKELKANNSGVNSDRFGNPTSDAANSVEANPGLEAPDTLISLLTHASRHYHDKTFLRFVTDDISEVTYGEFAARVTRLASGLRRFGIGPGDVVAGMMVNSEEMVRTWFAVMWVGAVWAPLNTDFRGITLNRVISLISPKLFIVDRQFLPFLPLGVLSYVYINQPNSRPGPSQPTPFLQVPPSSLDALISHTPIAPSPTLPTSTACLLLTSGTTGPSKACALSHGYFLAAANALITSLQLLPSDILYCPFPLCHADATSLTVIPVLVMGAIAAISTRFSASRWWNEIRLTRATVADFMGATLSILFKAPVSDKDKGNTLRMMWGVPVPPWVELFEKRFGLKVVEVYGATETGLPVVQPLEKERVPGSCGVALPGVGVKVVDAAGVEVKGDSVGEILVKQAELGGFTSYFRDEESTRSSFVDGWFKTGDLGKMDNAGNLFFVGRRKHVIRRRGENISSFEVEEAILAHPDVIECAAYGVPSDLTEEDVKISIVIRQDPKPTHEQVYEFAKGTMTRFLVPRYIETVSELPRTPTGKLEVFKLKEMWANGVKGNTVDFGP